MAHSNEAVWLDGKGARLRIGPAETPKPGKGEVLLEIHAVAINPADWAQQETGLFIEKYPYVPGLDAAGMVVEVGEGVTHVSKGMRVLAFVNCLIGQERGAFQRYAIATGVTVTSIPNTMSFPEAAAIPLAYLTAAAGLYLKDYLALPLPSLETKNSGKTLLIWGGATSVACMAIQLAVASGVEVITTSSPRNFESCKKLGANQVFDYNSDSVVEDIKGAFKGKDCIGVFEASGMDDSMRKSAEILSDLGGGFMGPVRQPIKDLPANVRAEFVESLDLLVKEEDTAKYVWQDFLVPALEQGRIKSAPTIEVIGKGLESIQDGITAWKKGVSAKKIVIEL